MRHTASDVKELAAMLCGKSRARVYLRGPDQPPGDWDGCVADHHYEEFPYAAICGAPSKQALIDVLYAAMLALAKAKLERERARKGAGR